MRQQAKPLDQLLKEELDHYRGLYVPVKSGILRRALIRRLSPRRLHPNPEDEFCNPRIGPNYSIISKYERIYMGQDDFEANNIYDEERLSVERVRPDGYMILNGHHRWAAARKLGKRLLPVHVVNLTREEDVQASLDRSTNTRRVTLDLDEVVFRGRKGDAAEKHLPFPWSLLYKQPMRLGVPALFRFLEKDGYDVWVYTSKYLSMEYLERYFSAYRTAVSGVVTGMSHNSRKDSRGKMAALLRDRYTVTVHIDRNSVLRVDRETGKYDEYPLSGSGGSWSREIMDIVGAWKYEKSE